MVEKKKMLLDTLEEYYRQVRKNDYEQNVAVRGIKWRKVFHFIIIIGLKISRLFSGRRLTIVQDKRVKTDSAVVYACTHGGRYDIEIALELIGKACYTFFCDLGEVYRTMDGAVLWASGVVYVDTDQKEDRFIAKETAIKILNQGGNILIYPEGAWNITENELVMHLYSGAVEMAIRGGADIVPMALEQHGKHFYVNIGENISCQECCLSNKDMLTEELRDILATLKWEIMDKFSVEARKDLPSNIGELFLESIMSETENGYTIEEIERTRFYTKEMLEQSAVEQDLQRLI